MYKLGEFQELEVMKKTDFGYYLGLDDNKKDSILLPKKEAPKDIELGDVVNVFVYKDSEDRLICTIKQPKITMGEIKKLRVIQDTKIGAFLEWGLAKDLFLPFKQQIGTVKKNDDVLVSLYVDKSNRLAATMKTSKFLRPITYEDQLRDGDKATGTIYNITEMGLFIAVQNTFVGLLPKKELTHKYRVGDEIEFFVTKLKEDGRLDLSLKIGGFNQMEADEKRLYEILKAAGGFLAINDKTDKDIINEEVDMSKRAFKRALGRLMKSKKVEQLNNGIKLLK